MTKKRLSEILVDKHQKDLEKGQFGNFLVGFERFSEMGGKYGIGGNASFGLGRWTPLRQSSINC